jgi:hypothetical protein
MLLWWRAEPNRPISQTRRIPLRDEMSSHLGVETKPRNPGGRKPSVPAANVL